MSAPKELMQEFTYTEADLEANRRGDFTDTQRERLAQIVATVRSSWGSGLWIIYGFIGLGIFMWAAVYIYNSPSDFVATIWNPSNLLAVVLAAVLIVAIVGASILISRRNTAGLNGPQLRLLKAQGKATVKFAFYTRGRGSSYWAVTLGNKTFRWLEATAKLFHSGATYCIYYCRSGPYEQVLSIDLLDS